jgi:hypothetical protein
VVCLEDTACSTMSLYDGGVYRNNYSLSRAIYQPSVNLVQRMDPRSAILNFQTIKVIKRCPYCTPKAEPAQPIVRVLLAHSCTYDMCLALLDSGPIITAQLLSVGIRKRECIWAISSRTVPYLPSPPPTPFAQVTYTCPHLRHGERT